MLNPKQKAVLKGLANPISQRYLIGKGEVDDSLINMLDQALESHELIKVGLLSSSPLTTQEVGEVLEKKLGCEVVQRIGRVILIYRRSKKNPRIVI